MHKSAAFTAFILTASLLLQLIAPISSPTIVYPQGPTGTALIELPGNRVEANSYLTSNASSSDDQNDLITISEPARVIATGKPLVSRYTQEKVLGDVIYKNNTAYPLRSYRTSLTPNDTYAGQWWESSLGLPEAWDYTTGSAGNVLAIIDTGVALAHEEFSGRWYQNSSETGNTTSEATSIYNCSDQALSLDKSCNLIDDDFDGVVDNESGITTAENPSQLNCTDRSISLDKACNRIDDDGNGLIDDVTGWDFVSHDNDVQAGVISPAGSGVSHATYVTGVAAATGNNSVGIAGVNWQTTILPIQALSDNGSGNSVSVARGIRYAVDQGADVISLSLGGAYPDSFLRQTIREAIAAGVIVVAASGNDGCNCVSYPANYPEVLAVGALDTDNTRALFSNYGQNLDIMAPGTELITSAWRTSNETSAYASGIAGTSLATPLVSGALALLKAHNPSSSMTELISLLTATTDTLTIPSNVSHSTSFGFGTADVAAALLRGSTSFRPAQAIRFADATHGAYLYPSSPLESSTNLSVIACESRAGSTAIYRLSKSGSVFYSSSVIEMVVAESTGYSASLLGYGCLLYDHDEPESIRSLSLFSEFEQTINKN